MFRELLVVASAIDEAWIYIFYPRLTTRDLQNLAILGDFDSFDFWARECIHLKRKQKHLAGAGLIYEICGHSGRSDFGLL